MGNKKCHNAYAVSVDLGNVDFSNPIASAYQSDAATTIDGNFGGLLDAHGWSTAKGVSDPNLDLPHTIEWDFSVIQPELTSSQSVEYYTYTVSIYYRWAPFNSLSSFTIDANLNQNGTTYNRITNFVSLESNSSIQTLSAAEDGTITGNAPDNDNDPQLIHSIAFSTDSEIRSLRINTPARASFTDIGHFGIAEVTGTATAEVVPEPSTYALITGLATLAFIAFRRKRSKA